MPIYCIIFPSNRGQSKEALEDSADDSLSLHTVPVPIICCRLWAISSLLIVHHLRVPFLVFICRFRPSCVPAWFDDTNNTLFMPCCGDKVCFFQHRQSEHWLGLAWCLKRGRKKNNVEPHVLHKSGFLQFLLFARKLSQFHFSDCLKESNHYKYISSSGLCRCLPVHGCVILWVIVWIFC